MTDLPNLKRRLGRRTVLQSLVVVQCLLSIILAGWIPLSRPNPLSSFALGLSLFITAFAILWASVALTRVGKVFAAIFWSIQLCVFILVIPLGQLKPKNQAERAILNLITLTAMIFRVLASSFNEWAENIANWFRGHLRVGSASLSALILLVLLAGGEFIASQIARTGLIRFDQPMITFYQGKEVDDWRGFHITADSYRVPDPYLMWKPVTHFPYNSKGYKGPEFSESKPELTYRIITVGDSNTDGPDSGAWPEELGRLLNVESSSSGRFEVINAGVAGYSSLQGVRRLEEGLRLQPDLVLVSFGANDAHLVEIPDKRFGTGRWGSVSASLVRTLFRYKAVLLFRYLTVKLRDTSKQLPDNVPRQPRVSLEDYEKTLNRMAELVRSSKGRIVFLTRPYDAAAIQHSPPFRWIHRAPSYRALTLQVGKQLNVPVFDAYAAFEQGGSEVFADEAHFTLLGHTQMAALLSKFLLEHQLLTMQ